MAKPSSKKRHRSACHWRSSTHLCTHIVQGEREQKPFLHCLALPEWHAFHVYFLYFQSSIGAKTLRHSLGDYVIGNHSYLCVVLWSHEDHPENKDKKHQQEQLPGWSTWKQREQCPRSEEDGRSHHTLNESQKGVLWEFRLLLSYFQSGDFAKSPQEIR